MTKTENNNFKYHNSYQGDSGFKPVYNDLKDYMEKLTSGLDDEEYSGCRATIALAMCTIISDMACEDEVPIDLIHDYIDAAYSEGVLCGKALCDVADVPSSNTTLSPIMDDLSNIDIKIANTGDIDNKRTKN